MKGIWRSIRGGSISGLAQHFAVTYLIPLGAPIVAAGLGYAQSLPLMYIFVGAIVAFAGVSVGMLGFSQWQFQRRVEDKLIFHSSRFVKNIEGEGFGLGLQVQNNAIFPIQFEVTELRTQIANRVPHNPTRAKRVITVSPHSFGWWDDDKIVFDIPKPGVVTGVMEFCLKYGRPNSQLRHEMKGNMKVIAPFDGAGELGQPAWNILSEAPQ